MYLGTIKPMSINNYIQQSDTYLWIGKESLNRGPKTSNSHLSSLLIEHKKWGVIVGYGVGNPDINIYSLNYDQYHWDE